MNYGKGRGSLIVNYVATQTPPVNYLNELHDVNRNGQPYNPYNLILLQMQ